MYENPNSAAMGLLYIYFLFWLQADHCKILGIAYIWDQYKLYLPRRIFAALYFTKKKLKI